MADLVVAQQSPDADQQEIARVEKFLRLAVKRFKLCAEAESETRESALDDLEFRSGKQWPDDIETQRNLDGRPCLTINRLPPIIRQVTNEQRQQRPSIQVNPVGSGADVDTAEIIQGMIRHIEVQSDAEIAYDTAFESMVTIGFGYFRICTDYCEPDSFSNEQEIKIKRIKNPFIVYFDPAAIEPDYCDARYCFVIEDIPHDEFRQRYPESQTASLVDFQSIGDQAKDWATKETIRVAEYWHVEERKRMLGQMEDGSVVDMDELPEDGPQPVKAKSVLDRRVICSIINAVEILDEQEWPVPWIPIIPVLADDLDVNGKRHLAGLVRDAKDPQRMYNYWNSSATETIALAPRAPFVGAEGQFENHEAAWQQANTRNYPYLEYKPVTVAGSGAPPPQRQVYEPPIVAMAQMIKQSDNDLKSTTGIYDASLGEKGPDQSGKAILARQKQGDIAVLHFVDNLSRAIRAAGRQIVELIPKVYDTARIQRIINPDSSVDHVIIYSGQDQQPQAQQMITQKINKAFDISTGKYDVTISVGPSYQSKRQEAVATQLELLKILPPQTAQTIMDMVVGNMDIPQSQEIAKRLKKQLPPNLIDDDGSDPEANAQRYKSQRDALMQQHELLVKTVNELTETLKTKGVERQTELDKARMDNETKITIAEIQTKAQNERERAQMYQDIWSELHGSAHELALQKDQQGHEADMQESQNEAAQELAAQQPQAGGAQANA